jgi:WD40 repeat protein/serine/threonine protein kinase
MTERDIFIGALQNEDPGRRRAYLDRACGDDSALRQRVEVLLHVAEQAGSFLEPPAPALVATVDEQPLREGPGTVIGPYRLMEQIGEGGMGLVFVAEQQHPVRRKVALKVIKPGMDTRQVIARFEAERQALALMDHPNIAHVFDGGATPSGRPYFVMELVKGVPITQFCDENRLTPRERLELFVSVCQAVQHAHHKGIIHRDLKPSNVLVTSHDGTPVVKVIDFGVAKAIGQQLTDKTIYTQLTQLVGTPLYMSPEQAGQSGLDIDTRTDVYALGVLLYDLLTGTTPFDQERLRQASYDEMRRIIREEEPPRPSTRLSTTAELPAIAANRGLEAKKLSGLVRGELDWIVMKCLEKDRNRRYDTANSLVLDLQRYLHDEPVLACPPSAGYRLGKFARRHERVLATAALLGVTLLVAVGAVIASALWAVTEAKARLQVELNATKKLERTLYLTHIALAAQALEVHNLGRAEELLDDCPGHLRGWEWHYLKRRRYESPRELKHPDAVRTVAFSPDGRHLAAGCLDGTVKVWDARTWQQVQNWRAHDARVFSVAWGPNSQYLASGGIDQKILVWDLSTGALVHTLPGHTGTINHLAFSPDGQYVASASEDRTVRLWDLAAPPAAFTFREHAEAVKGVAFHAAGGHLVSASADGHIKIWDRTTGAVTATRRGHIRWVASMAFHTQSHRLALGSWDGSVELWDDLTGNTIQTLHGHMGRVTTLAFRPDGERLVSAGDDKALKVWDTTSGHEAIALPIEPRTPIGVAFSPDGLYLATGCENQTVVLWNGTPLSAQEPDAQALRLIGHLDPVTQVAFSPNGRHLASASRDGTVKLWEAATGQELRTFRGHTAMVTGAAFSRDGRQVASGSWDETVQIWEVATGHVVHRLSGQAGFVNDVAFSPDGSLLASAHADGTAILWDPVVGKEVRRVQAHEVEVTGVAFQPDGKVLATAGGRSHKARLWDVATGKPLCTLQRGRETSAIWHVAFSPDGRRLATADGFGVFTVWDAASGEPILAPPREFKRVCRVAFSPDGRLIATAGWDQTVRLWGAMTGEWLVTFRQAGCVWGVAFSPDGQRLAVASGYQGRGELQILDAALWKNKTSGGR